MNCLFSNDIVDEERPGWKLKCPKCNKIIYYTVINLTGNEVPVYMYCDCCSNFVIRDEDANEIYTFLKNQPILSAFEYLDKLYDDLEKCLPKCPSGGHFKLWSNVKCPHCGYEFPYNNGIHSKEMRYFETKIIWIEGAIAFRDKDKVSNRLRKVLYDI